MSTTALFRLRRHRIRAKKFGERGITQIFYIIANKYPALRTSFKWRLSSERNKRGMKIRGRWLNDIMMNCHEWIWEMGKRRREKDVRVQSVRVRHFLYLSYLISVRLTPHFSLSYSMQILESRPTASNGSTTMLSIVINTKSNQNNSVTKRL